MGGTDDFFSRPGSYGAHNIYENTPRTTNFHSEDLIFATFFNGGMRVFDISNPFQPQEVAYFVPPLTVGASSVGINDVHVDENGIIYVTDRIKGGLYILEMTI